MTLLVHRCLGRQIAAHPLAADRCWRMLQAKWLKSLPNGALAAPSHARVRIIHRSNGASHPIFGARPLPDLPAGRFLHKMAIGPKHETWRRRPPASLQAGRRGATTGFAPPVTAQRWTCIDHGAAEGALPAANIDALDFWLRWIRGSRIPPSHAQKRSVRPSPPVSDRPRICSPRSLPYRTATLPNPETG